MRDFRWVGRYVVERVLPNDNYVARRINTNKIQTLHRIREPKYNSDQPFDDSYHIEKLQRDKKIVVPQDDLFTIARETEFEPVFDNLIRY